MSLLPFRLGKPQEKQANASKIKQHNTSLLNLAECQHALMDDRLMLVYDAEAKLCAMSDNALELLPCSMQEMGKKPFTELLHPSHRDLFDASSATLPVQKRAQFRHRSGHYHWYGMKYYPHPQGTLVVLEPIDTLVAVEKQCRKAQIEAEHSARERAEFLRHMSHELRTPLNAMMGFARMMEQGIFGEVDNPIYQEYLRLISQSGEDLLSKIVDLMDLSAIGSHHVSLYEETSKAHELLQAAIEDVQKTAISRHITMNLLHRQPVIELHVDKRLLRKTFCQILQNAIEFNEAGGHVDIEAGIDLAGAYVVRIKDNGHGIQHTQLKALQIALNDSVNLYSNVEAYRPIGLGLTLAKEYVHLHGGDIAIDSRIGVGTEVTITLPPERITPVILDNSPVQARDIRSYATN